MVSEKDHLKKLRKLFADAFLLSLDFDGLNLLNLELWNTN